MWKKMKRYQKSLINKSPSIPEKFDLNSSLENCYKKRKVSTNTYNKKENYWEKIVLPLNKGFCHVKNSNI